MKKLQNIKHLHQNKFWGFALAAAVCGLAQPVFAASGSWTSATSGNWSTGPWTGGTPNGPSEVATFSNNWSGQIITVDIPVTVGQILAADTNSASSGLTISSGTLTLDNGANSPVISTFTNNIFNESAATRFKVSSVLDGANGFERQGSGYLDISGVTSIFTGTVKLTAPAAGGGSFTVINSDANLGNAANTITASLTAQPVGFYNDASAGTFALNPARSITTSGSGDFWVKNKVGASMTIGGAISGPARLRKNDTGTLILTNNNTFTGGILVEGGTLKLGGGHNLSFGTSAQFGMGAQINNTTLDMSELGSFSFIRPAYDFQVASSGLNITNILNFAKFGSNTISANNVRFGGGGQNVAGQNVIVGLGQTNIINATNEFLVGYFQGNGNMSFQSGLTSPTLIVRGGAGGASAIGLFRVGQCNSGNQPSTGILNLTGGSLDVVATNFDVAAQIAGASTAANGTLVMPAGNVVASTLSVARKSNSSGTPTVTGTFNQSGGTVTATNLYLGNNESVNAANLIANYNLSGGELLATVIGRNGTVFGASSTSNLTLTGGTLRNIPGADLTISDIALSAPTNGNRFINAESGRNININARFTQLAANATPVIINGAGTLDLQGTTDNAFLGLNVSNGVVLLNKTSSGSVHALGADSIIAGGTLKLSGTGGDQISNTRSIQINSGSFDINGLAESIGGLGGSAGSVINSGASAILTLSTPTGSNYVAGASLNNAFDLEKTGAGKQTLSGTDSRSSGLNTVTQGTLEIGNGGATGTLAGDTTVTTPGILAFNRSGTLTFTGNITGSGDVAQNGPGTLILSGSDTHTGNTLVNTGTLQLPAAATTIGGSVVTVTAGATFDTTPGGGGFFIAAGQVLKGAGTVAGNYIIGSQGTLSGTLTNTGSITGAATDSTNSPGGSLVAGTLRVNGSYANGPATLVYDLASTTGIGGGTNDLLVVGGNLDISSACTLEIHQLGGSLAAGTYVLATYGTFSGSTANITVVGSPRYTYALSAVSGQLRLAITGNSANLAWRGDGVGNAWDQGVSTDWFNTGSSSVDSFFNGDVTLFDDVGATNPAVDIQVSVSPASLTVNSSSNYTFTGVGSVDGGTGLTKSGTGTLTIGTVNGFSGNVALNGGTVSVANLAPAGSASGIGAGTDLNFNGGALQYTGAAVGIGGFSRNINLGAGGGTIDQESTSGIYLFVTNKITGAGSLTKAGSQQLILGDGITGTGSNDYSGITYINAGNVQIRNAYALGSTAAKTIVYEGATLSADGSGSGFTNVIPENIDLAGGTLQGAGGNANYGGSITLVSNSVVGGSSALTISGPIGGPGALSKGGSGTLTILNGTSTFTGGTTNTAGTLQLGNGTVNGTLPGPINIEAGTLSALPATNTTIVLPGSISGSGQLLVNNIGGTLSLTGTNDWIGTVNVNAGALWINDSSSLGVGAKNVQLSNGTFGQPSLHLNGTNGNITLPVEIEYNCSWVSGVMFNEAGSNTILGPIKLTGGGGDSLFVVNAGNLNLAGTISATVTGRGFRLGGAGNGIVSGVVDASWGFAPRELLMQGTGTWTVSSTNAVLIPANVSSGRLLLNGEWAGDANAQSGGTLGGTGNIIGNVSVATGGTLSPGASIGTLSIGGSFTNSGNLFIEVNKSLVQSNDYVSVIGSLTNTAAGTLTVTNLGPALVAGDRFVLFSQLLPNGNALAVAGGGAGVTWTNNLAVDGSISVLSVASPVNTNTFTIGTVITPTSIQLSWPPDRLGWTLQTQTNALNIGLGTNWVAWPGSTTVTNLTIPINPANPSVFIRMTYP